MENILEDPKKRRVSSKTLVLYAFRLLLGLSLGIIFSVVGQEIIGYGQLVSIFIVLLSVFTVLRVTRNWGALNISILAVFFFLLFLFIKTYISLALGT